MISGGNPDGRRRKNRVRSPASCRSSTSEPNSNYGNADIIRPDECT